MRKILVIALLGSIFILPLAVAGDNPDTQVSSKEPEDPTARPWFDVEKCAFCKAMASEPGLLENMKNEYYNLKSGIISFTIFDKELKPAFQRAEENMMKVMKDISSGNTPYLCGHCSSVGQFNTNVKTESIETSFGYVILWTSTEPEVVGKLQAFGARYNEEYAKFQSTIKPASAE